MSLDVRAMVLLDVPCNRYRTRTIAIRYCACNILPPKRADSVPERLFRHDQCLASAALS